MKNFLRITLLLFFAHLAATVDSFSQDRIATIQNRLEVLAAAEVPGLNEKVNLSLNGVSIQEFIRAVAIPNNINVTVDPSLNIKLVNNFANVTVSEVFLFLCKNYDLDITFTGSIMTFKPYSAPAPASPVYTPKQLVISYDKSTGNISFDLNNDSLYVVSKEITRMTGKNLILSPDLKSKIITSFIQDVSLQSALEKMAFSNDLKVTASEDYSFLIEKKEKEEDPKSPKSVRNSKTGSLSLPAGLIIKADAQKLLTVEAVNTPIADIIAAASQELGVNYFLFSEIKGNSTLKISGAEYDEFLRLLLNGTDYTYKKDSIFYLFGDRNLEGLRSTKVVQMKYRTVEKLVDFIPPDLKKGVDIKIFSDLNSLILSGSQPRINEIEMFLRDVDRVVPVIVIEVLIVDVRKSHTVTTGLTAGLDTGTTTKGTLFPGVNMNLSSSSINEIISSINGFGVVNIGKVTPDFYVKLQALETQGNLSFRSTPKLTTLNGNESKMSIGRTEYYLETSNNVIGSQNPQNIITQQYKSVTADLAITINPIVSGDEQITLDIYVKQSSFTERISPSAPPGTITRDFKSLIRVKNQEMVILGGLEENSTNDSGSGTPLLSRIPVLKWFFSSRTKTKGRSKLTIFIRPTVIY